ncbi:MAG: 30S ribosomal protein S12 methylthiotransferase RimO [Gammaproteobacteria bacterium]|nr:30S ribosomal protein S12 methylthiotransferase RimO [Gammaproteobacteria bacterium]MCF6230890.1 30S ribosomal protein S12 methylthiotransferase RimO [Gammaproteobacteria bacterium]
MPTTPKIGFISLGCPKATVDTEQILTQLRAEGYELTAQYDDSELVIVNTCGFIDSAVDESLDAIGEALRENGKVIVTGCLGAKEGVVETHHPQVLAVTGPHALQEVMALVHHHIPKPHDPYMDLVPAAGLKLTPSHYAYLKISEGCNHSCRFCIIPDLRGKLVSRPIGDVLEEAENLAKAGVKELLVISQDTSAYGVDVKYRTGFWGGRPVKTHIQALAEALGKLGIWIRMHYVYPYPSVDNLIPLMAEGKILPYLDIPFQHASPAVLKQMRRPGNIENTFERIQQWRSICPDIAIRSTFITGFPGETEQDFEMLLQFLSDAKLDRVGCFPYSAIEGAKANELPKQIDEELKIERAERLMDLQAAISADKLAAKVGAQMTVLVDNIDADGMVIARSYADAPEIDGEVLIEQAEGVEVGDFVDVEITHSSEHDLWGKMVSR